MYKRQGKEYTHLQFRGNEGKREAILGLLRLALTLPSGQELWCLMQDTQRWFTEDDTYINTWESVNLAFLAAGNSIRVIHTIDRHYDMLAKSLLSWLPLYLTGKVMPYLDVYKRQHLTCLQPFFLRSPWRRNSR